ncbi:alport syndrome [Suillus fuscotomentosus]|uniref:Alport syndrome n=1 Tax=Suillus fuscotomentosus TaxID=1912939 RepID=A0AAD4HT93_9AGAM|nr:alport syndrome [Suillus fuscotomentosus]KAG1908128.1 alport syndrome [Suillus fuscotomentosus]
MEGDKADKVDNVCTPEHCFHAFDALYCALTSSEHISPNFADEKYPLFVTWNTRSSRAGRPPRLRGCIGNFDAMPLRQGLAEYALISAFKDSRFRKIERRELPSLECGISLLTDFEDASSYLDWTVGTHGIYISFPNPSLYPPSSSTPSPLSSSAYLPRFSSRDTLTATYLPDVIPDQGWDKVEAVESAMRKAGWNGAITEETFRTVKLRRYQSRHCVVGWEEFVQWRRENDDDDIS